MKIQKILSAVFAAVIAVTTVSGTVLAEEKKTGTKSEDTAVKATMCFDSGISGDFYRTFGDTEAAGIKCGISAKQALKDGALAISLDIKEPSDNTKNTGIIFESADFGLENLAGCTVSMRIYPENPGADNIAVFAEGDIFLSKDVAVAGKPIWTNVKLEIPEDIENTSFGVIITNSGTISGTVCYVDELFIYDKHGNPAANIGDFQEIENAKAAGTFSYVLMIIVFVLLIILVVGGVTYFVFKHVIGRYR